METRPTHNYVLYKTFVLLHFSCVEGLIPRNSVGILYIEKDCLSYQFCDMGPMSGNKGVLSNMVHSVNSLLLSNTLLKLFHFIVLTFFLIEVGLYS